MGEVTLTVSWDPRTGAVGLQGPLDNALLVLGMLELAKAAFHKAQAEREKGGPQGILVAPPGMAVGRSG